jgi:hypothetical protein
LQGRPEDQTLADRFFKKPLKPFPGKASQAFRTVRFLSVSLVFLGMLVGTTASAVEVTLTWDPNTEPDLDGYTVYYSKGAPGPPYDYAGDLPLDQIPDPDHPKVTLTDLEQYANYYFALTAYDINGNESSFSSSLCIYVDDVIQQCAPASEISGAVGGGSSGGGSSGTGTCFIGVTLNDANVEIIPSEFAFSIFGISIFTVLLILFARKNRKVTAICRVLNQRHPNRSTVKPPPMDD